MALYRCKRCGEQIYYDDTKQNWVHTRINPQYPNCIPLPEIIQPRVQQAPVNPMVQEGMIFLIGAMIVAMGIPKLTSGDYLNGGGFIVVGLVIIAQGGIHFIPHAWVKLQEAGKQMREQMDKARK